jgi:hypothetical protein
MIRSMALIALSVILALSSCAKQQTEEPKSSAETFAATQTPDGPHVIVHLMDGSKVPGTIVASSQSEMVVAGDRGIESKIPMAQIQSVEYGAVTPFQPAREALREPAPSKPPQPQTAQQTQPPPALPPPPPPEVTTRTYELPAGSEVSVRTNEAIDSATAVEGQTFDAQVTRDAKDADGDVVIPRGSTARLVIKSASKGGRFRGASDLVLDLQSVTINGKQHIIDVADISQKGKSGVGANKRTAEYAGGGAALGAIIGAIAGGGKGAAIGAGAGAGAGVLTQVLTKGGAIKVPVESVLTFKLDKPLKVIAAE